MLFRKASELVDGGPVPRALFREMHRELRATYLIALLLGIASGKTDAEVDKLVQAALRHMD
jgi:hypothetical protein